MKICKSDKTFSIFDTISTGAGFIGIASALVSALDRKSVEGLVMTFFNLPRHERTPETEIDLILSNLSALYDDRYPDQGDYAFINTHFKELYENEHTNGDVLARAHHDAMVKTHGDDVLGTGHFTTLAALVISCAYCCQAQWAWDAGRLNEAWTYIIDAREYCGLVLQRAKRIDEVKLLDHSKKISVIKKESRAKGVKLYDYSEFILNEYKSKPWGNKSRAAAAISESLKDYVEKNNLPIRKFKTSNERGDEIVTPQDDFYNLVWSTLPSAKQVKKDRDNFKNLG